MLWWFCLVNKGWSMIVGNTMCGTHLKSSNPTIFLTLTQYMVNTFIDPFSRIIIAQNMVLGNLLVLFDEFISDDGNEVLEMNSKWFTVF